MLEAYGTSDVVHERRGLRRVVMRSIHHLDWCKSALAGILSDICLIITSWATVAHSLSRAATGSSDNNGMQRAALGAVADAAR